MPTKKIDRDTTTQTGSMPRIDLEPLLRREAPPPPIILDKDLQEDVNTATTGEMPVIQESVDEGKTCDEDSPAGR